MYKVENYRIPKDRKYSEFTLELVKKIQENNDNEAKDILFRLTYPLMLKEATKYTDLIPMEEMDAEISLAFLTTLRFIKTDDPNFNFVSYYKSVIKSQVLISYYGWGPIKKAENRKRYRDFKNSIISAEEVMYQTSEGADEAITLFDHMIDETVNVEEEAISNTISTVLKDILDRVFASNNNKTKKAKDLLQKYIELKISNPDATSAEIAKICGTSGSNLANIKCLYLPRIRKILIREGYHF